MDDAKWGKRTEAVAISISTDSPVYRSGQPIIATILLKNFGDTAITVVKRSIWIDYAFELRDQNGLIVAPTQYARQAREGAELGRRAKSQLIPSETLADTLPLDKAFDLKPGIYKFVASRPVYCRGSNDTFATVISNELTFQVEP